MDRNSELTLTRLLSAKTGVIYSVESDEVFNHPPDPTPEELRAALPPITRRQLRLTLVRNGIALDDVAAMIEAMPEGLAKEEARIEWDDASQFERLHPTLVLIGQGLGLTPDQVDTLWLQAVDT